MENKYYTPELSEFHIGFEYEIKDFISGGYKSQWVNPENRLPNNYILKQTRVKYLDQTDVEDLGFVKGLHKGVVCYDSKSFRIFFFKSGGKVSIDYHNGQYFRGKIKNKSELVRVLKMIGYES